MVIIRVPITTRGYVIRSSPIAHDLQLSVDEKTLQLRTLRANENNGKGRGEGSKRSDSIAPAEVLQLLRLLTLTRNFIEKSSCLQTLPFTNEGVMTRLRQLHERMEKGRGIIRCIDWYPEVGLAFY